MTQKNFLMLMQNQGIVSALEALENEKPLKSSLVEGVTELQKDIRLGLISSQSQFIRRNQLAFSIYNEVDSSAEPEEEVIKKIKEELDGVFWVDEVGVPKNKVEQELIQR